PGAAPPDGACGFRSEGVPTWGRTRTVRGGTPLAQGRIATWRVTGATHPIIGLATSRDVAVMNRCTRNEARTIEVAAAVLHCGHRKVTNVSRASGTGLDLSPAHGHSALPNERGRERSDAEAVPIVRAIVTRRRRYGRQRRH